MAAAESIRVQNYSGRVAWFHGQKGFGFIRCEELGRDFYVHYSQLQMDGYKTLKEGEFVIFEVRASETHPGRQEAVNVRIAGK